MDEHNHGCECPMCQLSRLDEGTEWSVDGSMLSTNDETGTENDDDGLAGVPSNLRLLPNTDPDESALDSPETVENICNTVVDMAKNGKLSDVLVVCNMTDDTQVLFTTVERNDLIIAILEIAKMNWHSSQIAAQNYYEEDV